MSDYTDQTRLLVAKREDEDYPMIIGAMPMTTWEVIPPEDWDRWKRQCAQEAIADDWTAYDYEEIVITIPSAKLKALFDAREFSFVEAPVSHPKPALGSTNPFPPVVLCDGGRAAKDGSGGYWGGAGRKQDDYLDMGPGPNLDMGPGPHIGTDDGGEYF